MIKDYLRKIFKNKLATAIIIVVLAGAGYFAYGQLKEESGGTEYVLAAAEKGTLTVSVSGSGQVSASNQVDVKPQASGNVMSVSVQSGQEVKEGAVLAHLDSKDAQSSVRDAENNLQSARLSLEKLKKPADNLSLIQAENALAQAKDNLAKLKTAQDTDYQKARQTRDNAEKDLDKAYDDGFGNVSSAFLDLPNIMSGLQGVLFNYDINSTQQNIDYYADAVRRYDSQADTFHDDAYDAYQNARNLYDKNFAGYKDVNRSSDRAAIEAMINQTSDTATAVAEAVKSATDLIQFYEDKLKERNLKPSSTADTHLSSLNGYTTKANTCLSDLSSAERTIENDKEDIISAERDLSNADKNNPLAISAQEQTIQEKQASLDKLKAGPDAIDIETQDLSIKQKQNALADARAKLADYTIRAPFDGLVAKVSVKKGDSASSGTAAFTMITDRQLAEISFNEVDVAKIKTGQKATLTFDAIDELNMTGTVAEIDSIGTVSQGVVSYNVKIAFDTNDGRIKPGMSVTANIITEARTDALMIPAAAVKTQSGASYVEILENGQPKSQAVQTGISNDLSIEVVSGLKEGDSIIVQAITASQGASQSSASQSGSSGSLIPGLGSGGGGTMRYISR